MSKKSKIGQFLLICFILLGMLIGAVLIFDFQFGDPFWKTL